MLLFELFERTTKDIVVVYPGRFQPFHKGHKMVYDHLCEQYNAKNVFISTSNKVDDYDNPFNFSEKLQIMECVGIDPTKVVETTHPYRVRELTKNYDPSSTILVCAVSHKDMLSNPRFNFKNKRDGSPSYYQPIPKNISVAKPLREHGYILTVPTFDFTLLGQPMKSSSELRARFASATPKTRKEINEDLFGSYNEAMYLLMNSRIK